MRVPSLLALVAVLAVGAIPPGMARAASTTSVQIEILPEGGATPPTTVTGGGAGGGGSVTTPITAESSTVVRVRGIAYPGGPVTLLRDGQIAAHALAAADGTFALSASGFSRGTYTFGVLGEDYLGVRSALHAFAVEITPGTTTQVSGAVLAPTVTPQTFEVRRGQPVILHGQSAPLAEVVLQLTPLAPAGSTTVVVASAGADGRYSRQLAAVSLAPGRYELRARAARHDFATGFGQASWLTVLPADAVAPAPPVASVRRAGDANGDGRVNLIDFALVVYWLRRPSPPAVDLNGDGVVTLADLSIAATHWTG